MHLGPVRNHSPIQCERDMARNSPRQIGRRNGCLASEAVPALAETIAPSPSQGTPELGPTAARLPRAPGSCRTMHLPISPYSAGVVISNRVFA